MQNLVLIHGFGFGSYIFRPILKQLGNFNIKLIDLPGYGSSMTFNDNLDKWVIDIKKHIPAESIVVGWSLGGLVAIKIAQLVDIKQLILLASSPKFVNDNNWQYAINKDDFAVFIDKLIKNPNKTLARFLQLQGIEKNLLLAIKPLLKQNIPTKQALINSLNVLLYTDLRQDLLSLGVKTNIVLGKKDQIIPIKIANWYKSNNFDVAILDSSGHMPFFANNLITKLI